MSKFSKTIEAIVIIIIIGVIGASAYYFYNLYKNDSENTNSQSGYNLNLYTFNTNLGFINSNISVTNVSDEAWLLYNSSLSVKDDQIMDISFEYLLELGLEYRNSPHVLNIYTRSDNSKDNLNNSQIFINFKEANGEISSQDKPNWFADDHLTFQMTSKNRTYFFDFNPALDKAIVDKFISSIKLF